jgi:hypothetical protein
MPGHPLIEDKQGVLAIARHDPALETQAGLAVLIGFQLAGGQQIAVGEEDALVLRKQHAGLADTIQAVHLAGLFVENQIAVLGFR